MKQTDAIIELFRLNGYRLTLGKLLETQYGYKCTSRFSDLRKEGYRIELIHRDKEHPSNNQWQMTVPQKDGQMRLV